MRREHLSGSRVSSLFDCDNTHAKNWSEKNGRCGGGKARFWTAPLQSGPKLPSPHAKFGVRPPIALEATGMDDEAVEGADGTRFRAQRAGTEKGQIGATECDERSKLSAQEKSPKPLQIKGLGDEV
jgi:hypothetical protein